MYSLKKIIAIALMAAATVTYLSVVGSVSHIVITNFIEEEERKKVRAPEIGVCDWYFDGRLAYVDVCVHNTDGRHGIWVHRMDVTVVYEGGFRSTMNEFPSPQYVGTQDIRVFTEIFGVSGGWPDDGPPEFMRSGGWDAVIEGTAHYSANGPKRTEFEESVRFEGFDVASVTSRLQHQCGRLADMAMDYLEYQRGFWQCQAEIQPMEENWGLNNVTRNIECAMITDRYLDLGRKINELAERVDCGLNSDGELISSPHIDDARKERMVETNPRIGASNR